MSKLKSRNPQPQPETQSISSDAEEWGRLFVRFLESEFASAAAEMKADAKSEDFQRVMLRAVINVLRDSGAKLEELAQAFQVIAGFSPESNDNTSWNSEQNARRLELIDKLIQQTITQEERMELARLTARMRECIDREGLLPLEGARLLHRQLLEKSASQGMPR